MNARRARTDRIDDAELERLERDFVGRARGRVLELGPGDGENFGPLDPETTWQGVEPNPRRRDELARRAREWGREPAVIDARAEAIPLPSRSVDTVLATYVLCSVSDLDAVLAEVHRVLIPGGRILLIDHVAAARGSWTLAMQRMATPFMARFGDGCHLDRDPELAVHAAGFVALDTRRFDVRGRHFPPVPTFFYDGRSPR